MSNQSKILIPFKLNNIDAVIDSTDVRVESGFLSTNVTASSVGISTVGAGNLQAELIAGDKILVEKTIEGDPVERIRTITSVANNNFAFIDQPFPAGFNVFDNQVKRIKEPDNYYIFTSGMTAFANTIPVVIDSPEKSFLRVYEEMAFGKKVEFSKMIRRIDWTSGQVYTEYDDLTDLANADFYVMNSSNQIFKCIDNNVGSVSTLEPTNVNPTAIPFETEDGYRWLYMYSLNVDKNSRLGTDQYIVVEQDETVKAAAAEGGLWRINVTNAGSGFFTSIGDLEYVSSTRYKLVPFSQVATASGTSAGTTATVVTATPHGRETGDVITVVGVNPAGYNGTYVATVTNETTLTYTTAGSDIGPITVQGTVQFAVDNPLPEDIDTLVNAALKAKNDTDQISLRTVTAYEVVNGEFFVNIQTPFDTSFATSSTPLTYEIGARVDIISQSGIGALAFGKIDGTNLNVSAIEIIAAGVGYLDALIVVRNLPGISASAAGRAVISPPGGHGFDVFSELYCEYLAMGTDFNTDFDSLIKYNQVGLLKNPIGADGEPYLANSFDQLIVLQFASMETVTGSFEPGDLVFGNDTRTIARVAFVDTDSIGVVGVIGNEPFGSELIKTVEATYNQDLLGDFAPTHKGMVSVDAMNPSDPLGDIKIFSGDIMYLNNIEQIDRSLFGSSERIKLILRF